MNDDHLKQSITDRKPFAHDQLHQLLFMTLLLPCQFHPDLFRQRDCLFMRLLHERLKKHLVNWVEDVRCESTN